MNRRPRTVSSLVLAGAVAGLMVAGCATEDTPPIDLEGSLYVGTAAVDGTGFIELDDGADATLTPGAQGGFHVWINVRVRDTAGELYLEREARRVDDDQLVLRAVPQFIEVPEDAMSGWWESPAAVPAFMCPTPIGIQVYDRAIEFTVRLRTEDDDIVAEDSLVLVPRCVSEQQGDYCLEICAG